MQYGINITPGLQYYNTQGGKGSVVRSNYIRFNYGRQWCISNQDDTGLLSQDNLYFRCGASGQDARKFTMGVSPIRKVFPFNGVWQLKMSYLQNVTSDVQQ